MRIFEAIPKMLDDVNRKYLCLLPALLLIIPLLASCSPAPAAQDTAGTEDSQKEETAKSTGLNLTEPQKIENQFTVTDAFPGILFDRPLDLQHAGDGSGRLFVVEQGGSIYVINNSSNPKAELFLDISDRVDDSSNEMGLLGLAFHPAFKTNGQFFVNYTTSDSTVVSRFVVDSENPVIADKTSEEVLLTFPQPYSNHNGGQIAFGPDDSYLYIATGDGGSGGDPHGNAQNRKTLLGKILRIDVDEKDSGLNYAIPTDNPFAGNKEGYREEIYAYGLRNPWRFSFDQPTNRLWAADVGQDRVEEIDIIEKGKNYGWNIMEGSLCFKPPTGCDQTGLELPVYEYQHPLGESIIGGYVYRGNNLSVLQGIYVYSDYVTGIIWGLLYDEGKETQNFTLAKTDLNITSFGIDEDDELYFTAFDGKIYRLTILNQTKP